MPFEASRLSRELGGKREEKEREIERMRGIKTPSSVVSAIHESGGSPLYRWIIRD